MAARTRTARQLRVLRLGPETLAIGGAASSLETRTRNLRNWERQLRVLKLETWKRLFLMLQAGSRAKRAQHQLTAHRSAGRSLVYIDAASPEKLRLYFGNNILAESGIGGDNV